MAHSFSSIKLFKQCPTQYKVVRIDKLYPYVQTPEAEFGDRAHAALEANINKGVPLPAEFAAYQWILDMIVPALLPVRVAEIDYSYDKQWQPVAPRNWKGKEWSGKADVMAYDNATAPTRAQCIDWKTGKSGYPDPDQLELMALFEFTRSPTVQVVDGYLFFTQDAKVVRSTFTRQSMGYLRTKWEQEVLEIENALATGNWPMKPSALCPWCPHKSCPNWTPPKPKKG